MTDDPVTPALDAPALPDSIAGALPGILARGRIVITPYPFGVSDADNLRVTVLNSLPGVVVNIHGRKALSGADAKPFDYQMTPTSNRLASSMDFTLGAGIVTNLSVFVSGATPLIGQTFVIVQLIRSMGSVAFVMGTLLSGYVTSTQALGWPGSPIETSIEGGGYVRQISGTTPAAGAEIAETVPTGARWEMISFHAALTTSGAAALRRPRYINTFGGSFAQTILPAPSTIAGGIVRNLLWTQGVQWLPDTSVDMCGPLPGSASLLAGTVIATSTPGMDAADQYGTPVYVVREWLEAN